jgi:hypothetical protein
MATLGMTLTCTVCLLNTCEYVLFLKRFFHKILINEESYHKIRNALWIILSQNKNALQTDHYHNLYSCPGQELSKVWYETSWNISFSCQTPCMQCIYALRSTWVTLQYVCHADLHNASTYKLSSSILPTHCMYMFCIILTVKRDFFFQQR